MTSSRLQGHRYTISKTQELMEVHSNAKAILITRGVDSWHTSVMKSIWWRVTDLEHLLISNYSWAAGMYYPMLQKFFDICFTGDFPNKGKQVYLNHVGGVRNLAQKERLLEHEVGES
ncbi:conserved hypothetical protein [Histoplasma capsulatum G186AR]|uniref:Uncharacterized protein n=1 Tax=Ajellomyces capsulatus (strain G186AR / H82 / ATCC MYA-2454 / RMSCC 2432) TaxID=447093 RepID=C0NL41_AJECG|nr:uncharacterized protein HCBG_03871 [Histoplasma capsulatum G186AR]EEH08582.1 conserved hypothetical protein [Histoplasma capsulatum G186AR]